MNDENYRFLAKIRYDRAEELQKEAEGLLSKGAYKSANNRAFYAVEKGIKAALALKGKDAATHNGVVMTFNKEFIHNTDGYFEASDLKKIHNIEKIRSVSDYDDFYIASKAECEKQVKESEEILKKVKTYLNDNKAL